MQPILILGIVLAYFLLLTLISYYTGRKADNKTFFTGDKQSPWYAVAYGMLGASLSGVTFISVPGWVESSQFSYMQMVLGYLLGYAVIAQVLLPLYYKLNLTSIYTYLEQRFGFWSYKAGAFYFLLSRFIGASFRLYLMASVLQITIFDAWNIPFAVTVMITLFFIWLYTSKGGIKTVVWTDTLQTTFMLVSVIVTILLIADDMNMSLPNLFTLVQESEYSKTFFFSDWNGPFHFSKQFFSGAFIAIVMTGLDQDMMQKNLTCRSLKDAQKNMYSFSFVLVFVNLLFLSLGAILFIYANQMGISIPEKTDQLFPVIATQHGLGPVVAVFFILGLVAAAYSSADSALTSLTTSFCIDFLDIQKKPEADQTKLRKKVHLGVALIIFLLILFFELINDDNVISAIFKIAGYTYGPLLGLFAFGLFTKVQIKDNLVWLPVLISPVLCFFLNEYSTVLFNGYKFGFLLLVLNGLFTFIGLLLIAKGKSKKHVL